MKPPDLHPQPGYAKRLRRYNHYGKCGVAEAPDTEEEVEAKVAQLVDLIRAVGSISCASIVIFVVTKCFRLPGATRSSPYRRRYFNERGHTRLSGKGWCLDQAFAGEESIVCLRIALSACSYSYFERGWNYPNPSDAGTTLRCECEHPIFSN